MNPYCFNDHISSWQCIVDVTICFLLKKSFCQISYICPNNSYMGTSTQAHSSTIHIHYNFPYIQSRFLFTKKISKILWHIWVVRKYEKAPKRILFIVLPFKLNQNAASLNPKKYYKICILPCLFFFLSKFIGNETK